MSLAGKVAVVTGGSRGIGRAICLRLAEMGAKVVINYVSRPQAAEETKAQVEALGSECFVLKFDVANSSEVQDAFKQITTECGRIDVLVCNAGITRDGLLIKMKEEDWDQVMSVNLKGAFNCIKAGCRPMMKQRWGRIIVITSVVGFCRKCRPGELFGGQGWAGRAYPLNRQGTGIPLHHGKLCGAGIH